MHLRVSGHFDMKGIPRLGADEGHQVTGVMKLTAGTIAAGQVATQRHQALDAHRLQGLKLRAYRGFGGANA